MDTIFIANKQQPQPQVSVWIHSNWQQKCALDKGNDGKTNTHEDGTNPDGLHPFADEEYNKRQAYWLTVCNILCFCDRAS